MSVNFTPSFENYTGQGKFRFWCQTVLPLIYDDSLSYMELLNKMVIYLNNTIQDVAAVESNVDGLLTAYNNLQQYVNDYFDNLDVQNEINHKLDVMAEDGSLSNLIQPFIDAGLPGLVSTDLPGVVENQIGGVVATQIGDAVGEQIGGVVAEQIPTQVTGWLNDNVTPVGSAVVVDSSLTISGAAADAKVTGDAITDALANIAPTYSSSATYSVGDYVMYTGDLYRCSTPITVAEAWTAAHWTSVKLGSDVADLKSAFNAFKSGEKEIAINVGSIQEKYVNYSNGRIVTESETYGHVGFIKLPEGTNKVRYPRIQSTGSVDTFGIAFYSSNTVGSYISGVKALRNAASTVYVTNEVSVPSSANYVAFSVFKDTQTYGAPYLTCVFNNAVLDDIDDMQADISALQEDVTRIDPDAEDVDLNLTFYRDSIAYDPEGNSVAKDVPVIVRGGMVVTNSTTNLLSSGNAESINSTITVTLDAGTYTISCQNGSMTVTIGADDTVVDFFNPMVITLESQTAVVLTPITTTCELVQIEKKGFPTPWNAGGQERAPSWINAELENFVMPDKFGVGFVYIPYTDMSANTNNEFELLYIESTTVNFIRIWYPVADKRFTISVSINDVTYSILHFPLQQRLSPRAGEPIGFYFDFEKGKSIGAWLYRPNFGLISDRNYDNIPAFGTVNRFQIGHKKTSATSTYVSNGIFKNIKMTTKPDAVKYFTGVLR